MDIRFFVRQKELATIKVVPAKLLVETGMAVSQAEGRRMVMGGFVMLNGQPVIDLTVPIEVKSGDMLSAGRDRWAEITQVLLKRL